MAFGKSHRDPYATSVGHLIEKATFAGAQTEDWGQFMHICDIINATQDGPKDAVKALKKRISKNYNHKEIQLTLSIFIIVIKFLRKNKGRTVHVAPKIQSVAYLARDSPFVSPEEKVFWKLIDMCMQNCGPSFQALIVKKEFIKESLVKLLNPRYTLPLDVQHRILNFIKTWSQGFPGGVDVSEVKEVYLDLLKKGVQFLPPGAEAEAARQETPQTSSRPPASVPTAPVVSPVTAPRNTTITLVPEQIGKLHSELDMVKMNVRVMSAVLMENSPGSENSDDLELLQKLYKTGREMQERIMDLLVVVENEDVTIELIQVNEDLNNAILGYERFTRNQQRLWEQNKSQNGATNTSREPSAPSSDLLDLSPGPLMLSATQGDFNNMNAQLSDLSFSSPSPVVTNNSNSSLYPHVDLLALENTEITLFPQRTSQNLTSSHTYANLPQNSSSVLLQPVSLQTVAATPPNHEPPSLPNHHQVTTKNDQPPNYYEVMEFDPLAPAATTEPIYEEIDVHLLRGAQSNSDC